jgi:23S rRNA pseudouridine2605 synthase
VDGNKVRPHKGVVIVLHKPRGLVCSRRDERDRDTIYSLLPEKFHTLHHVGRLDKESEGLLLMTNRGEVSQRLLHPSQGVEKEYEVITETRFDPEHLTRLTKGFHTEDGYAKAERAWMIGDYKIGMVLKQGLKRQIRMMLYFLGYEVKRLVRVRIGNLGIKGILEGNWKELSDKDVDKMLLNPQAKDRPKMSKPKTAAVRKSLETHRQKEARRSKRPASKKRSPGRTGGEAGPAAGPGPRGTRGPVEGGRGSSGTGGRSSERERDRGRGPGRSGGSSSGPRGRGRPPQRGA